jgi:hypothetical protein
MSMECEWMSMECEWMSMVVCSAWCTVHGVQCMHESMQ